MQPIGSYGWAYGETVPRDHDAATKTYEDLTKSMEISWEGHALLVALDSTEQKKNYFTSDVAETIFGAATNKFNAIGFKFHHPSEHTINGKHSDLEMQVWHEASGWNESTELKYAAISIFFDSDNYTTPISDDQNATVHNFLLGL